MARTDRQRLAVRGLALGAGFVMATGFAAIIPLFWHDKLYVDGLTIVRAPAELVAFGNSFSTAAFLLAPILGLLEGLGLRLDTYGLIHDQDLLIVNTFFGGLFFLGIAALACRYRLRTTPRALLAFVAVVVLFAPFYYNITKELLPFVLSLAVLLAYRAGTVSLRGAAWMYACLLGLCGIYFRIYYLAFGLLFLVHWLLLHHPRRLCAFYVLAFAGLFLLHGYLPLDLLNKGRANYLDGISSSRIEYYLDDSASMGFVGNRVLTLAMLLAPLNLLTISVAYAPFVAAQLFLLRHMAARVMRPQRDIRTLAAHAMAAFTVIGALFEPDFGSYFRHKVGLLPWMLLLVSPMGWREPLPAENHR